MVSKLAAVALAFSGVACSLESGTLPPGGGSQAAVSQSTPSVATAGAATNAGPPSLAANEPKAGSICGAPAGASRPAQACWRWRCDGAGYAKTAATWSGDSATCSPGDLDADAADRALRRINVHRFLADVAPFTAEAAWTEAAQQCALIAHANAKLSHEPPRDSKCWSKTGAETSAGSLVANVSIAPSIAAYFEDPGNGATLVHRRWLLDETLGSVGLGSTDHYSCVVVDGHTISKPTAHPASSPRGWSAWPPAGPVPLDVFSEEKLDAAGWSIQSTKSDLDHATVTVTRLGRDGRDGESLPVTTTHLTPLLGSRSAIRFVPQGWGTEAGQSYAVHVTGVAAIDFTVEPFDCDAEL